MIFIEENPRLQYDSSKSNSISKIAAVSNKRKTSINGLGNLLTSLTSSILTEMNPLKQQH